MRGGVVGSQRTSKREEIGTSQCFPKSVSGSERLGPSDAVSFEFLNVQRFVIGLAASPYCEQDLGPFLSQAPKNRLVDVVLAAAISIVSPSPFGVGQAGETPVSECAP